MMVMFEILRADRAAGSIEGKYRNTLADIYQGDRSVVPYPPRLPLH